MDLAALVIDDHPLYRGALAALARSLFPDGSVAEAQTAEEGLRLAREDQPLRLILLDFRLPGAHGAEAVRRFRQLRPSVPLVVVSASEDRRERDAAMRAGATAFLSKGCSPEALAEALLRVLQGGSAPAALAHGATAPLGNPEAAGLTPRQLEILALLSQGRSNKEIGDRLGLALVTVKTHVSAIFRALGVANRTQAVLAGRALGLLSAAGPD